jgi:peptidoglycan L-alanyl-D-glutamate endopeptidase CwlK
MISNRDRLRNVHPALVALIEQVGIHENICVVCGQRGKDAQNAAVAAGTSQLKWPNSAHNKNPSMAVDLAPLRGKLIPWNDIEAFKKLAEVVLSMAEKLGLEVEWGGNWRMRDYPHFELKVDPNP